MEYRIRVPGPTPRQVSRFKIFARRVWRDYHFLILGVGFILVLVLWVMRYHPSPAPGYIPFPKF